MVEGHKEKMWERGAEVSAIHHLDALAMGRFVDLAAARAVGFDHFLVHLIARANRYHRLAVATKSWAPPKIMHVILG